MHLQFSKFAYILWISDKEAKELLVLTWTLNNFNLNWLLHHISAYLSLPVSSILDILLYRFISETFIGAFFYFFALIQIRLLIAYLIRILSFDFIDWSVIISIVSFSFVIVALNVERSRLMNDSHMHTYRTVLFKEDDLGDDLNCCVAVFFILHWYMLWLIASPPPLSHFPLYALYYALAFAKLLIATLNDPSPMPNFHSISQLGKEVIATGVQLSRCILQLTTSQ